MIFMLPCFDCFKQAFEAGVGVHNRIEPIVDAV